MLRNWIILAFGMLFMGQLSAQSCRYSFDELAMEVCAERLGIFGDSLYVNGLKGVGRYMDGEKNFFTLGMDSLETQNGFSLAFWFLPSAFEGDQMLIAHIDPLAKADIRVALAGNRAMVQQRDDILSYSNILLPNQWYFCAYTYEEGFVSVRIENSSFRFAQQALWNGKKGRLVVGQIQGHSFFKGTIDEMEWFPEALSTRKIKKLQSQLGQEARVDNDYKRLAKFKKRVNEFQDSIRVNSLEVTLKVWDDDLRDDDVLQIYLNGEPLSDGTVNLRKSKDPIKIRLLENQPNEILFYALSMGRYEEFNTASVRVLVQDVAWGEYELRANADKNAVLLINFDQEARPQLRAAINPNEQKLKTIRTSSDKIKLYLKDHSLKDKDEVAVKFNESPFLINRLEKTAKMSQFALNNGHNDFWFQANRNGWFKCTATITVKDEKDRKLGEFKLEIGKDEVYRLPIVYKPKPSTRRELVTKENKIIIRILDDQEYDGDTLAITQNGILILDDTELTKKAVDIEVDLKENQANIFRFIPVSTGDFGGNSCLVRILTANKEKVITTFKMEAYLKEQPALMIIEQEGK